MLKKFSGLFKNFNPISSCCCLQKHIVFFWGPVCSVLHILAQTLNSYIFNTFVSFFFFFFSRQNASFFSLLFKFRPLVNIGTFLTSASNKQTIYEQAFVSQSTRRLFAGLKMVLIFCLTKKFVLRAQLFHVLQMCE